MHINCIYSYPVFSFFMVKLWDRIMGSLGSLGPGGSIGCPGFILDFCQHLHTFRMGPWVEPHLLHDWLRCFGTRFFFKHIWHNPSH